MAGVIFRGRKNSTAASSRYQLHFRFPQLNESPTTTINDWNGNTKPTTTMGSHHSPPWARTVIELYKSPVFRPCGNVARSPMCDADKERIWMNFHVVRSEADWVSCRTKFLEEIFTYNLMSLDSETLNSGKDSLPKYKPAE